MGIPAEQQNYADRDAVTLIKSSDHQASMWETVRGHPGLGGAPNMIVTLPPTNGMADLGKRVRVRIVDVTGGKFCRVIGYGGANAATIKKLGAKKIKYIKYLFAYFDKYNYFGDLINNQSAINEDPQYNMGLGLTLRAFGQSIDFVWDGVSSWWSTETHALTGLIEGSEIDEYPLNTDRREFSVPIFNRGVAGQNPPTEVIESALGLFRAVRFNANDQIFLQAPISNARRNFSINLELCIASAGQAGSANWELKALGIRGREGSVSGMTPTTKNQAEDVTGTTGDVEVITLANLEDGVTPQDLTPDNVNNRASYLLMRLKSLNAPAAGADLYSAVLSYVPYGYRSKLPFEESFFG